MAQGNYAQGMRDINMGQAEMCKGNNDMRMGLNNEIYGNY